MMGEWSIFGLWLICACGLIFSFMCYEVQKLENIRIAQGSFCLGILGTSLVAIVYALALLSPFS